MLQVLVDFPTNLNWCKLMQIPFVYVVNFCLNPIAPAGAPRSSCSAMFLRNLGRKSWSMFNPRVKIVSKFSSYSLQVSIKN